MPRLSSPIRPNRAARSRRLQPRVRGPYALLGGLAAVLGAALLYASLVGLWIDERVRAWPTTPGRILSVEMRDHVIGVTGRILISPVRERRFHVRYSYAVAGASYTASQIGAHTSAARVSGRPDRYVVDQRLPVHYNPSDPQEAVLETPFPVTTVFGAALGVVLLCGAGKMYRARLRRHAGIAMRDP